MKKTLLILTCLVTTTKVFAQNIEVSAGLSTGIMHYAGKSAESVSSINGINANTGYTNNPYGSKNGVGFGGNVQAQLVLIKSFIVGLQGSYESLKSKIDINQVYRNNDPLANEDARATSSTMLRTSYLTLNPYIGYRLPIPVVKLDILAGIEFAHITDAREKGSAKTFDGTAITTDRDRKNISTDNRLKFGLNAGYNRFGLFANYSHGLRNYYSGYIGGPAMEAHTEIVRIGLNYRIY
ncbi:MAG: outer membrane beta-barrel protein [Bacteroidota bacterium]